MANRTVADLITEQSAPKTADVAPSDASQLPPGFTVQQPATPSNDGSQLPAGFTVQPTGREPTSLPGFLDQAVGPNAAWLNAMGKPPSMQDWDNMFRQVAQGATFGGADHLAAWMSGKTGVGGPSTVEGQQQATADAAAKLGAGPATVGRLAGGAMATGALLPEAATATAVRAGLTGAALGGGGTTAESYLTEDKAPSVGQVATGTLLGLAGGVGGYKLGELFTRPRLDPTTNAQVETLNKAGVDITAGQATNNPGILAREAQANGAADFAQKQAEQFSTAVLNHVGIPSQSGRLTTGALNDAFEQTGRQMDQLAANNPITDQQTLGRLWGQTRAIAQGYYDTVGAQAAPVLRNTVSDIYDAAKTGQMSGEKFQEISSALGRLQRQASSNPDLAHYAGQMRQILNNTMESSIKATNPTDAGLWGAVNRRFSNLMTVQNVFDDSSVQSARGLISPQALATGIKQASGARNYARGATDLDGLARAGLSLIRPLPIAQNLTGSMLEKAINERGVTTAAGYALGNAMGNPVLGTAAGLALPTIKNAVMSPITLAPVASMSPTAASTSGSVGAGLGTRVQPLINPFLKALGM